MSTNSFFHCLRILLPFHLSFSENWSRLFCLHHFLPFPVCLSFLLPCCWWDNLGTMTKPNQRIVRQKAVLLLSLSSSCDIPPPRLAWRFIPSKLQGFCSKIEVLPQIYKDLTACWQACQSSLVCRNQQERFTKPFFPFFPYFPPKSHYQLFHLLS